MPLTNAQKVAAYRARKAAKHQRWEAALRAIPSIVNDAFDGTIVSAQALDAIDDIARNALKEPQ